MCNGSNSDKHILLFVFNHRDNIKWLLSPAPHKVAQKNRIVVTTSGTNESRIFYIHVSEGK